MIYQEKMTKMVIGGSQLITGNYSEIKMLPLEGAAVAYNYTFYYGQIYLLLYLCFNRILYYESSFTLVQLKYFLHYITLLVNFFADLAIHNVEFTHSVYNSGQRLLVCNLRF